MVTTTPDTFSPSLAPTPSVPPTSRDDIRRQMRRRRRALSRAEARQAARALARQLGNSTLFLRSRHIAFYLANDGEMDLMPLIERAWAMGKHCYLPVLSPTFHNRLWFARFLPDTALAPNRFRIPEPLGRGHELRPAWSIDLMLTPLVAFDGIGNRLGMGGGFYDRTLAYLLRRDCWHKPELMGIAYEFQRQDRLPHAPWDVPLHGVATDQALHRFGK
ncbi:MAG: 5-formyltetrahydrofolate cyclo-ligase [Gammaproteobacteria bacterium HGW-Gammaproteobacteria-1]|jgi:5-formyltetrahydrofolate cyclo-ligase|nr:MAG: 5-formyltetrahydrofolate cyclo-ligase [Gammaproteobacteria bacterium HGW-Gammaproteobacteria-1]